MQTFLYSPDDCDGRFIVVKAAEARHMKAVLRLKTGDMVRLIDGQGTAHLCQIDGFKGKDVLCSIIKTVRRSGEADISLTLAAGLSSGYKFDVVIEKGTEAGISRFVPLLTDKGKVKVEESAKLKRKMNRWRRVAEAAAKQSGRSVIPEISEPVKFSDYISGVDKAHTWLFHPQTGESRSNWPKYSVAEVTVVIGPESGFSPAEIELAKQRNINIISIGDRILRTETAGIIIPALFIYLADSVKE